jgi:hypothetical protein
MPVTCPNGHRSTAGDYCDECGAQIQAAAAGGGSDPAATAVLSTLPAATAVGTQACPACGTPRIGDARFCENDAYDFLTGNLPAAEPPAGVGTAPTTTWTLTVNADRQWWTEMATELPFPEQCPERRFPLSGDQVLLGRGRPSRGINPQVDLTGPPVDEAISHAHALLTRADGGWQLSDAGSTNGTWLPGQDNPLAAGQHVLLTDGDTFYLGAWTAVTVHTA